MGQIYGWGLDLVFMSVSRPSRVKVAHIYFKRAVRWRRNSNPFISGDAFADLCDFVFNPPKWRNHNRGILISDAKTIFCKSHELQGMLDKHSEEISAQVIICGNSDFEFYSLPEGIPNSTRALFLQNSFISDNEFIFTIPIGLENFRLGVNGNPRFIRYLGVNRDQNERILFGPLSATHPIRDTIAERFSQADPRWDMISARLSPKEYDLITRQYSMIAAVRGNGVDTHRLWESLYRGATPIVAMDAWWVSLCELFPQAVAISDWNSDEILKVMQSGKSTSFDPTKIDALWMPFWEQKIRRFLSE
jgi:hypothetical protein